VLGVDFSGGFAAAIAAIDTALGANVTAQLNGASTLEVLDDGAAALSDIDGLSVRITASGLTDQGLGLPFFTDSARQPEIYSESLEGGPQKRGFAARIVVNAALLADPSRLVVSSTSPLTQSGDSTRPLDLEKRLNDNPALFSPNSSIGSASVPFKGTIGEFIQRVIDFQGAQAATAERDNQSSTLIVDTLQERFTAETGVNMDEELSRLLILQNSYAANARVLSAVNEMLQLILQI
jgi:flagellar hook-associated protein 1 FlgK